MSKQPFAQTLVDLVKAFERVPHQVLAWFALQFGYCGTLLKLSLAAYRLHRAIGIGSIYSRLVVAVRGVTGRKLDPPYFGKNLVLCALRWPWREVGGSLF